MQLTVYFSLGSLQNAGKDVGIELGKQDTQLINLAHGV